MKKFSLFKNVVIFLLIMGVAMVSGTAMGQEDQGEGEFILEEIVITGSRIVRRDFEAVSPIVTVDEELFYQSATSAIETQLNKLPQFTPTMDVPTFGGDIQPTARNTPGEATVALRGLGANRSLVLINGRRGTPSNGSMYVDINTIPLAAIERVEAISGGASATYGADAMAGVVNFIMRRNFVGFEVDAQTGMSQYGDNIEYRAAGIMGADIGDDRGNVSMAFSYNRREDARQRDRPWYKEIYANPQVSSWTSGRYIFPTYQGFVTDFWNLPDVNVVNTVMGLTASSPNGMFATIPSNMTIFVDEYGQAFSGLNAMFGTAGREGTYGITPSLVDNYRITRLDNGMLTQTNLENYLILPLERYNIYTSGHYKFNDWIGGFMQGYFSKTKADTTQEPAPIASFWGVMIDPTINRNSIPLELLTILDSRPNPAGTFQSQFTLPFDRSGHTEVYTFNIVAGLEGKIPGSDWTYELFVSAGEAQTTSLMSGFGSLQRVREIITWGPDFGAGASIRGNQGPPGWGFAASTGTCTSGLNPFDWGSVTDDCWNAILADIKSKQVMEQYIWEANFQGAIAQLPAGEMRGAVGYSTRKNDYHFWNDTLTTEGRSFIEQSLGLYPAQNSVGFIEADEVYGEALIPILSDLPLIRRLDLELGGRRSDYSTTGASWTYKALADWRVLDWMRVRGGYNRAERAPNMAELALAPEQLFSFGAARGDVCAWGNTQAHSANPTRNPNWANVINICGQMMEAAATDADDTFYGADYRDLMSGASTPTVAGALGPGGGGAFPHIVGNPDVFPETADTWTVGIVANSPWEDNPWLADLRVTLDWYTIEVSDAIGEQTADVVMQMCVDPRFNPTYDPNHPYCKGFSRTPQGGVGDMILSFVNTGWFSTSGMDLSINWGKNVGPGRLGVYILFNYLLDKSATDFVGVNPIYDYTGASGPYSNGLFGASYEWQALTTVSYNINNLNLAIRWNYYDLLHSGFWVTQGWDRYTPTPKYMLFDLTGSYNLTNTVMLRFGIENLLNKKPPLTGADTTPAAGGLTGGGLAGGNVDTLGRRFYMGVRMGL
ncbi:MAG: hypothetical protein AMJ79_08365 [Phycisphaerae bacterium SM23_30]|nr:MAG: hypothetical protein AMJ79_08365 [Phycisphaerae bacterium SM23_30]